MVTENKRQPIAIKTHTWQVVHALNIAAARARVEQKKETGLFGRLVDLCRPEVKIMVF